MSADADLTRQMSLCRRDAEGEVRRAATEVIDLCEPHRAAGRAFTLASCGLDGEAALTLASLSDRLIDAWEARAGGLDGVDGEAVGWAEGERDGLTTRDRLDRHASRLLYALEGWVAIGFANALTARRTAELAARYAANPFGIPEWAEAVAERGSYSATIIRDGDLNRRSGLAGSITSSLALVGEGLLNAAFRYAEVRGLRLAGATRYGVRRGSAFDCPTCDEVCSRTWPVGEVVLPVHPRCMCYPFPA